MTWTRDLNLIKYQVLLFGKASTGIANRNIVEGRVLFSFLSRTLEDNNKDFNISFFFFFLVFYFCLNYFSHVD